MMSLRRVALVVLGAGIVARIAVALLAEPWTDELYTAFNAPRVPAELAAYAGRLVESLARGEFGVVSLDGLPVLAAEAHPPLSLVAGALVPFAAAPAWWRLPALVSGAALLVLVGVAAGRARGAGAAVTAVGLAALAAPLVVSVSEARPYAHAALAGLATTLLATPPAPGRTLGWSRYVLYAAAAWAGLMTHYYTGPLLPAQLAIAAWRGFRQPAERQHARRLGVALVVVTLAFAPWLPVVVAKASGFHAEASGKRATLVELAPAVVESAGLAPRSGPAQPTTPGWHAVGGVVLVVALAVALRRWATTEPAFAAQAGGALVATLGWMLIAPQATPLVAKHLVALPGVLALALAGLAPAADESTPAGGHGRRLAVLLGLVVVLMGATTLQTLRLPREPWAAVARDLVATAPAGQVIAITPQHAYLALARALADRGHRLVPAGDAARARWRLAPLEARAFAELDDQVTAAWILDQPTPAAVAPVALVLVGPHGGARIPPAAPGVLYPGLEGTLYVGVRGELGGGR